MCYILVLQQCRCCSPFADEKVEHRTFKWLTQVFEARQRGARNHVLATLSVEKFIIAEELECEHLSHNTSVYHLLAIVLVSHELKV